MPGSATTHDLVRRMLEQIQRNYTQRVTLDTLAQTLGRQSAYLGRLFHEETGVTVHEYITRARMAYGAAHVRSGVKIEAVALDLGYRSKKNFYRQFKRRFGMTPEAYRHVHHDPQVRNPVDAKPLRDADGQAGRVDSSSYGSVTAGREMIAGEATDRVSRLTSLPRQMLRTRVRPRIAMLVTDDTGCYVAANEIAVCMTGYSVDELRGMSAGVLFPDVSDTRGRLQVFLPASSSQPINTLLHTKSAGPVHVHLTSTRNLLVVDRRQMRAAT